MEPMENLSVSNTLKFVGVKGTPKNSLITEQVNVLKEQMLVYIPPGDNPPVRKIKGALQIDTQAVDQFEKKRKHRKKVKQLKGSERTSETRSEARSTDRGEADAVSGSLLPAETTLVNICEFVRGLQVESPPLGSLRGRVHWKDLTLHDDIFSALYCHRSQTVEILFWAQQKVTRNKRQKGYLITFNSEKPQDPIFRPVELVFTRTDEAKLYQKRLELITAMQGPKYLQMQGEAPLHSWTVFSFKGKGKSEIKMLFDISEESHKLRALMGDVRLLNLNVRNQMIKDILKLIACMHESDPPRVRRNLSLSGLEAHVEVGPNSERLYRVHMPKITDCALAFVDIDRQTNVPVVDRFAHIDYEAPENFEKMDRNGNVHYYIPSPAEDVWAAGIIFYRLFWNGAKPDFMKDQREFRDLSLGVEAEHQASPTPISQASRGLSDLGDMAQYRKTSLLTSFETSQKGKYRKHNWKLSLAAFNEQINAEAQGDKVKRLIVRMLDPDPLKRIKASDALSELDVLMRL